MDIRRAQKDDLPQILNLLGQVLLVHHRGRPDLFRAEGSKYTEGELVEIIADDNRPVFVADDAGGGVVGYAFCVCEDYAASTSRTAIRTLYVDDICVDEGTRGQHVGTALYRHVVAFAREQAFHNVTLNVWSCNPGAMRFYEAMGMRPYRIGMEVVLDEQGQDD